MTKLQPSKRDILFGAGALGATWALGTPNVQAATKLDFTNPLDNLNAYIKLQATFDSEPAYQWFVGKMDIAIPGQKIQPFVEYHSLVRRDTVKVGDNAYEVSSREGTYFTDVETGEKADSFFNPFADREVRPFHFREGPTTFLMTEDEPRLTNTRDVLAKEGKKFILPWTVVGNDVWVTRENFIEVEHPMDPDVWQLETPGDKVFTSSHSTHRGKLSDLENPDLSRAPADFLYQATSIWLPWMLMGKQPGWLIWRAFGRKINDLSELPPKQKDILDELHPELFVENPWNEFSLMFFDYQKEREPAKP